MGGVAQRAVHHHHHHARSWWGEKKVLMPIFPFYGIVSSCNRCYGLNIDVRSRPARAMELKWCTFAHVGIQGVVSRASAEEMRHGRKHCHVGAFIMWEPEATGLDGKVVSRRLFQKAVSECIAAVRASAGRVKSRMSII